MTELATPPNVFTVRCGNADCRASFMCDESQGVPALTHNDDGTHTATVTATPTVMVVPASGPTRTVSPRLVDKENR